MTSKQLQEKKQAYSFFSKRRLLKSIIDCIFIAAAYYGAYLIRFDFNIPDNHHQLMENTLLVAVLLNIFFINLLHLNRSQWRYSSIQDLINITGALTAGWIAFIAYIYFTNIIGFSRSVIMIYWLLSLLFLGGIRFLPRISVKIRGILKSDRKRVLIIGAGNAGEMIIRQILRDPKLGYQPIALIDDDEKKQKAKIHGVPVLGTTKNLHDIVKKMRIDEIIISVPSASAKEMRHIVQACETTGIEFITVPGLKEIVDGKIEIAQLRKVEVEDLLDRRPVEIDLEHIRKFLNNEVVLVTGAGGSIGSELSRQILQLQPKKLICLDRSENSLFFLEHDLEHIGTKTPYKTIIADILDIDKLSQIFYEENIDVIFHAAAYKHVPLMEMHPDEAIRNNVVGTLNMVKMVEKYNSEKFVFISTDKAVNPTSVMGASKRVAELLLQSFSVKSKTQLVTVRFGNVLGSFGSVVPLFQKQIADGGPVTITDENMCRFFMTIPEAVKLILQSAKMSSGNDIFVLDMGEPIKLVNIAKRLIKLSGLEPEKDIAIKIVGTRPGEKMYEELWNHGEVPLRTDHPKINTAVGNHYNHWDIMSQNIAELIELANSRDTEGIIYKLKDIIPEYLPNRVAQPREVENKKEYIPIPQ